MQEKYTHSTNQILFQRTDFVSDQINLACWKLLKMAYTSTKMTLCFFFRIIDNKKCAFTVDSATAMLNATFK